jgi:hypothetical protein
MDAIVTFRTANGGWKSINADVRITRQHSDAKDSGRADSSIESHAELLDNLAKAGVKAKA